MTELPLSCIRSYYVLIVSQIRVSTGVFPKIHAKRAENRSRTVEFSLAFGIRSLPVTRAVFSAYNDQAHTVGCTVAEIIRNHDHALLCAMVMIAAPYEVARRPSFGHTGTVCRPGNCWQIIARNCLTPTYGYGAI